jgi:hypothetical protein
MDIRMDSQAAKFSDKEIHLHVKYCIGWQYRGTLI